VIESKRVIFLPLSKHSHALGLSLLAERKADIERARKDFMDLLRATPEIDAYSRYDKVCACGLPFFSFFSSSPSDLLFSVDSQIH